MSELTQRLIRSSIASHAKQLQMEAEHSYRVMRILCPPVYGPWPLPPPPPPTVQERVEAMTDLEAEQRLAELQGSVDSWTGPHDECWEPDVSSRDEQIERQAELILLMKRKLGMR